MNGFAVSALSGAVATGPMTLVMSYLHRRLPRKQQYPLPPRNITMKLAHEAGVKKSLREKEKFTLTMMNHFGYGAAVGALYFPLSRVFKAPKIASGMAYGFGVWAVSYLGWLPAIGLYPAATKLPLKRNLLMIGAHLVWGASLGILVDTVCSRKTLAGFESKGIYE